MKKLILFSGSVLLILIIITIILISNGINFPSISKGKAPNIAIDTTADNDDPEVLYKQNTSIDFLVYHETAFVNATDIAWVMELNLKSNEKIGEIERTHITKKFKDFDATLLDVGTEIYSVKGRNDIVLVSVGNSMIPYFAYVEG